ncbi:GAF domain-containing protein [Soonwooa sp.]|uniref:GAF domain-containing protein n=1 Tax=Soonwooa sp. TaxID=1938592 RepID=UPI002609155D|nr:GAF domain-containing protein [Soonwooa sp.]
MTINQPFDTPFVVSFTFETLIQEMQNLANEDALYAEQHAYVLNELKKNPRLADPITDRSLSEHDFFYKQLLKDLFPPLLTENEIKAVGIPFANFIYNPTKRFQKIIENAGEDFYLQISGFTPEQFYVLSCCVILDSYFKAPFKIDFPFIYDIPSKEGYLNHYRILTNADFLEIIPLENSKILSAEEIEELVDNYDNIELWKEKFPPKSWKIKGFGIINMYDATSEIAVSNLKSQLIQAKDDYSNIKENITSIFRSIFRIADLDLGYTAINYKENKFEITPINTVIESKILSTIPKQFFNDKVHEALLQNAKDNRKYFAISDIDKVGQDKSEGFIISNFKKLGIKSAIFAPLYKNQKLLGIIELTSASKSLNSINANKMNGVIIYLEDTINQLYEYLENHVVALIQQEYTSIHPSVYWKFHDEAMKHINIGYEHPDKLPYKSITFEKLIPFYGQSDVKSSSNERNKAILKDIQINLDLLISLLMKISSEKSLTPLIEKITDKQNELQHGLKANTESEIQNFLQDEIYPSLNLLKFDSLQNNEEITAYYKHLEKDSPIAYHYRKQFDDSISRINKELSNLIDKRQDEQQKRFPFYYERFKTDGVEHNFYMGASIAPWLSFDEVYLKNLRIWQLRVITESEITFRKLRETLATKLDITSLILVYSTPISIRFRMDEKRFDVDGSYNARYEMIKKRIDKSHIKDSNERLVKTGKISIVFSQEIEKIEYLEFIKILQNEGHLKDDVELLQIEDLQGIAGLQAIRVGVNYANTPMKYEFYPEI